ncbi:ornithine cyclodeaminase family protein [Pseudomonas sp. AO-1]|uniref:ornithine cyclodeaminase family protein n=1 Tax=unclassified Pseudomonas TaxID=196821 RepID=UPI000597B601|nr:MULTISPECIES: ornithine cyclodeaminase family protein [unclassified Pseudomonas]KIK89285.1 ornithine cyclodeaminase [Pseudomonas sp. W15Feb9B]QXZ17115.1 ornithine cyclodeaminase family protein [Pseudomonas sp. AO-1]
MYLNAQQLADALPWDALMSALSDIFTRTVHSPVRHHHKIEVPGDPAAMLLLMPAWIEGEYLGVKQVTVFPGNNAKGQPGLSSHYLLSCAKTGLPLGQFDGNELTARRTAAASALASRYLSRADSKRLLMVGAGRMGRYLVSAHRSVRDLEEVIVYDLNFEAATAFANDIKAKGIQAKAVTLQQLPAAAASADIISCATLATEPVIQGQWLKPGVHLDLVGSFTPAMREVDDDVVACCSIFVDTREGALAETGDLIQPIKKGVITEDDVIAEFSELCAGKHSGRAALKTPDEAMTLFKSVGASVEDLAAAILAYQRTSVAH